jgi:hypothetical protein
MVIPELISLPILQGLQSLFLMKADPGLLGLAASFPLSVGECQKVDFYLFPKESLLKKNYCFSAMQIQIIMEIAIFTNINSIVSILKNYLFLICV